ncbi:hypothetical protein DH2020_022742 [Rehmannia glutinosa]|uniref:CTLH domain-containing protein n=1 Tax=Rehmannia glutinosa TaxID=99300 RepID=A0ABR0W7T1_REHGL
MGGVEDDEPPSKRVKVSSGESGGLSNGISVRDQGSCSISDSMARLLASQEDDEVVGSRGVIKKVELVRIIAEALYSLGYSKTGARLEEESGIPLHSSLVDLFVQQILDGQWDESVTTLHEIDLTDESITKLASFVILEQKFFELLDGGKLMDALKTLRTEIAPLCVNGDRVRELSYVIVSPSQNLLERTSGQESRLKSRKKLLEELQKLLPPTVIIPENRLVHLVEQALDLQRDACRFHNSSVAEMSLLTDHQCGRDRIPCQTLQILQEHSDEVWFLQFSHNGKYLASSSGDCLVIIWEVKVNGQVSVRHRLSGHQKPVSYISWSPDDHQLLTCGMEETIRRWDITSGECLQVYIWHRLSGELVLTLAGHTGAVNCVSWNPANPHMLASASDDRTIRIWGLNRVNLNYNGTNSDAVHCCNGKS